MAGVTTKLTPELARLQDNGGGIRGQVAKWRFVAAMLVRRKRGRRVTIPKRHFLRSKMIDPY